MKISIVRGGGIAGLRTRTELDSSHLKPDDDAILNAKLRDADAQLQTQPQPGHALPDELQYELTLQDDRQAARTARYSDSTLPEPVRALIAFADSQPASTTQIEN